MALIQPCFLADEPLQVFSIAYHWHFEDETRTAAAHAVAQGHLCNIDAHLPALAGVTAGAYYRLMQLQRNHPHAGSESTKDDRPPMPTFDGIGPFCREAPPPSQSRGGTIPSVFPPFTDPRADLVIESRDGRKFRVHRAIIDAASPTLLSSLLVAEDTPDREGDTPTYRMPENSTVVDTLLHFCYPGRRPRCFTASPESAVHFLNVLAAMQQYALAAADDLIHAHWAMYAWREPFRFFFHAVARGLAPEAHRCAQLVACSASSAALHTLYVPEMEGVGALAYHPLLSYVQARREAALHSVHGCSWGPEPTAKLSLDLVTHPCVDGVKCVCADGALAADLQAQTLPPALLQMLGAKLHAEPRGGALLNDRALVDALAEAVHNAMCAPEFHDYLWMSEGEAYSVGEGIAKRVDEAASQVKLDLVGVLE